MSTIARCVRFSSLASFFSTSRFKSQFAFFGFNNDGYETKNQKHARLVTTNDSKKPQHKNKTTHA